MIFPDHAKIGYKRWVYQNITWGIQDIIKFDIPVAKIMDPALGNVKAK